MNIDFKEIRRLARPHTLTVCRMLLPGGILKKNEYVVLNPTRNDHTLGSFSVNIHKGVWADFATGDRGDVVALVAYVLKLNQVAAAQWLVDELGLKVAL